MLEQIVNLVKQFGQDTVVNNPEVPNEYNQEVLADASSTITNGFQNILAGGGFENILDLFKGRGGNTGNSGGGIGSLLKNPIVTMMVGYFISKLVNKYKMSPSSASNLANNLIPNALSGLITQTNDPNNPNATLDNLVNSLTGGNDQVQESNQGGFSLQNLLEQFTGGGSGAGNAGGFDIQSLIGNLSQKAQSGFQNRQQSGGLMDMIKGFLN